MQTNSGAVVPAVYEEDPSVRGSPEPGIVITLHSDHAKNTIADVPNDHVFILSFWDKHRDMRRRHAISLTFSDHYQDIGI